MVVNLETKNVAIVKDTKRYLELVVRERNLNPNTVVFRVVPDGGGGTFKVMVSVFDGNCDSELTFQLNVVLGQLNTRVNRLLPCNSRDLPRETSQPSQNSQSS